MIVPEMSRLFTELLYFMIIDNDPIFGYYYQICHILFLVMCIVKMKENVWHTCYSYILILAKRTGFYSFIECYVLCTVLRTYLLSYKILPISAFWILHKLILSHTWRKMTTRKKKCFRCVKLSVKIWFPIHRYHISVPKCRDFKKLNHAQVFYFISLC